MTQPVPGQGQNTRSEIALIGGPSTQATAMAASLAYAVNTASPMSRGDRVWNGDPGYGVHRFNGEVNPPTGDPSSRAIAPIAIPVADSVRIGAQGGPSSPAAYPSTGNEANYGAVAGLDMGKLGNMGWGN